MQPRRDVFAENFIGETVKIYQRAIKLGSLNSEEKKWVTDVLVEYFNVVRDTKTIANARQAFIVVLLFHFQLPGLLVLCVTKRVLSCYLVTAFLNLRQPCCQCAVYLE